MNTMPTVRRVGAAELIKLRTLRTHGWLMAAAAAFIVLLGPIQTLRALLAGTSGGVETALTGVSAATLLVGVLGVLSVTGEYAPRAIRTTFTLVPQRGHVVLAKTVALALVTAVAGAIAVATAVTASTAILHTGQGALDLLRISAATVWVLVGWGVLGQAAGWLTRSKIGGAALLIGVMVILQPVLSLVPGRIGELLAAATPSAAAGAMVNGSPAGLLLWTAYLAALTVLSAWAVTRRDA
jgi:ABC-2 type transport system permease protein